MTKEEITSVGWLRNADSSIALVICLRNEPFHVFVTISKQELDGVGSLEGIDKDKQIAVDFYLEKGPGRPEDKRLIKEANKKEITRLMVNHSGSINEFNAATGKVGKTSALNSIKATRLALINALKSGLTKLALEHELMAQRMIDRSLAIIEREG